MPLLLSRLDLDQVTADPEFIEHGLHLVQEALIGPADPVGGADWPVRLDTDHPRAGVALVAPDDGALLAILAADALAVWRTALPAGLVARYLAPAGAGVLGVRGTGPSAQALVRTLTRALPSLAEIVVDGGPDFAAACGRHTRLPVRHRRAEEVDRLADVLVATGPAGTATARAGALVLGEKPMGPRTPMPWDLALDAVLTGGAVPRPDAHAVVLGGSGRAGGWERAVYAWALRRAWELDLGRTFTLD
ncbi:hypothetical protein L6E12_21380 [Actinokineospora sp. PR83]|uniref:hypothetical protein n=1 Tax=Actinokineospora sp. PR83 TaxID=2884908 RepID=UPI0027E0F5ED|nr:hypothetical protein [Actinokineospora sp. PR83]MCG8918339.1 hypothetical protein [Actinokineospora sp. PR83]